MPDPSYMVSIIGEPLGSVLSVSILPDGFSPEGAVDKVWNRPKLYFSQSDQGGSHLTKI